MRVLIADKLPDLTRTHLAASGFEVRAEPALNGDVLQQRLQEFEPDVLVVRSTRVQEAHALASTNLSLVIRAGAGINTIDVEACSKRGIFVANCPGKNAVAVAELTMGLLLALDRFIPDNVADIRAGSWNKAAYSKAQGLKGRTLGIIGLGAIGRAVTRRAQAFGMNVVGWSRSLTPASAEAIGVTYAETPEQVARDADAVSVHLALSPETRDLVGDAVFDAMKHGGLFLNTSRAEVVNEASLTRAIEEKGIRAGLDVLRGEPAAKTGPFDHALAKHPSVYVTHHIGASTLEAQEAVGSEVCRIIEGFRNNGHVLNAVNVMKQTAASHRLVVRHLDQVGVLAHLLEGLSKAGINVQEMENLVFPSGAAIARIQVSSEPGHELVERLQSAEAVLQISVVAI